MGRYRNIQYHKRSSPPEFDLMLANLRIDLGGDVTIANIGIYLSQAPENGSTFQAHYISKYSISGKTILHADTPISFAASKKSEKGPFGVQESKHSFETRPVS